MRGGRGTEVTGGGTQRSPNLKKEKETHAPFGAGSGLSLFFVCLLVGVDFDWVDGLPPSQGGVCPVFVAQASCKK